MKRILFLIALLGLSSQASAHDPFDNTDWALMGTAVVTRVLDCAQTRYAAAHPDRFREKNIFLGSHPSQGQVNLFCGATLAGTVAIGYVLPSKWRKVTLGTLTLVEGVVVIKNNGVGVGFKF